MSSALSGSMRLRGGWGWPVLVVGAFFLLGLVSISRHDMWRDELRAWLIAAHSPALGDLLRTVRYEGHGCLWYLLLWCVAQIWPAPQGMQYLHLVLATMAVVVFWLSPFDRLQKTLFTFGYFVFFEYCVLARGYVIVMLLLFMACWLWPRPQRWPLYAVLFLLAQTEIFGLFFVWAFAVLVSLDLWARDPHRRRFAVSLAGALAWLGLGSFLALAVITPPGDNKMFPEWHFYTDADHWVRTAGCIWRGLVAIPRLTYHFWNTNVVEWPLAQATLGSVLLVVVGLSLVRRWLALLWLVLATGAFLAFVHCKMIHYGYVCSRHEGQLFIAVVAAWWLAAGRRPGLADGQADGSGSAKLARAVPVYRRYLVTGLLAIHAPVGIFAVVMGWTCPFSGARDTARFIQEHYPRHAVVEEWVHAGMALTGYLGRPIYFPSEGRFLLYNEFRGQDHPAGIADILADIDLLAQRGAPVLLVFSSLRTCEGLDRTPAGRPLTLVHVSPHAFQAASPVNCVRVRPSGAFALNANRWWPPSP